MNIVFLILAAALVLSVLALACVSMVEMNPFSRHAIHRPDTREGKRRLHLPRIE